MTSAYITASTPAGVAREVELLSRAGNRKFIMRLLDGGGMLDLERLGAARHAAGLQAEVELEGQPSPVRAASAYSGAR